MFQEWVFTHLPSVRGRKILTVWAKQVLLLPLQTLKIPLRIITSCGKKVAGNAVRESRRLCCLVTNSKHSNLYVMSYIIPAALSQTLRTTFKIFQLVRYVLYNPCCLVTNSEQDTQNIPTYHVLLTIISIWSLLPCHKFYLQQEYISTQWISLLLIGIWIPKMILKVWKISSTGKKCCVSLRYVSSSPRVRLGPGKLLRHLVSS